MCAEFHKSKFAIWFPFDFSPLDPWYLYGILVKLHPPCEFVLSPGPYVLQNAVRVVNNTRGKMKMSGSERKPPAKTLRRIKVIDSVTTSRSSPVPTTENLKS